MDGERDAQLAELIDRFSKAEESLRGFLDSAEKLATARDELIQARGEIDRSHSDTVQRFENAEQSLQLSQKALADMASGIYDLASELKDVSRDMKDTSIAFRALKPDDIEKKLLAVLQMQKTMTGPQLIEAKLDKILEVENKKRKQIALLFYVIAIFGVMMLILSLYLFEDFWI